MRNGHALAIRVRLADNEWDSSFPGGLKDVADELFALMPDLDLVEVNEHAGWWLHFGRIPADTMPAPHHAGGIGVVATANDTAAITEFRRAFWQRHRNAVWDYLPTVHRGNVQDISKVLERESPSEAELNELEWIRNNRN